MNGIVDRLEGEFVLIEVEGKVLRIKRSKLPSNLREGDVLVKRGGKWVVDLDATETRRAEIERRARELWEDD